MDPDPNSIVSFLTTQSIEINLGIIIAMIGLLVLSAYFSAVEISFSAFNKVKMKALAQNGDKRAETVLALEDKYDKLINSILVGDSIVNVVLVALCVVFFDSIMLTNKPLSVFVAILTSILAVLVFGEVAPKKVAEQRADGFLLYFASVIKVTVMILTPFAFIFGAWGKLVLRISRTEEQGPDTEDELITIVDEAQEEGIIETEEGELIRSAIEFNDACAGEILTPRVDICAISQSDSLEDVARAFTENAYSRLPVYGEDMDDIVGILHEKDFFIAYHNKEKSFSKYIQKPVHVSENINLADLLKVLKSKKCHMAVVVDEFGGTMGIVTMEDIIEQLIGDVWDEHDEVINDYKELPDGSVIVKCSADLDDFFEHFGIEILDEEDMPQTVNGFIMKELEAFPQVGDTFDYKHLRIEIKKLETKRVDEIKVTRIVEEEKAAE